MFASEAQILVTFLLTFFERKYLLKYKRIVFYYIENNKSVYSGLMNSLMQDAGPKKEA